MKQFQLFTILLFAFSTLKAQENPSTKQSNIEKFKNLLKQNKIHLGRDRTSFQNREQFLAFFQPKPVFLFETEKGKVYANPLDNMRFPSPEFNSKIPVDKGSPLIYIPNAVPVKK
jgi:hypothetical protein